MAKRKSGSTPQLTTPSLPAALSTPWDFLRPTEALHALIAGSTKQILDPLAASVAEEQSIRRQINKKRKRLETDLDSTNPPLQLKSLYVDGFTSNQIWEQAIRILASSGFETERDVALLANYEGYSSPNDEDEDHSSAISDPEEPSESDGADDLPDEGSEDASMAGLDEIDADSDGRDPEDQEEPSDMGEEEYSSDHGNEEQGTYTEDRFGLNDGFFSIDDFNKQSEFLERQDTKGEVDDADDSEEEIDWDADPTATSNPAASSKPERAGRSRDIDEDEAMDDSSEDDGPTFGNANLHADSDSDDAISYSGEGDATEWANTSDIKYADFFLPPPRKASSKKARALPKTHPTEETLDNDVDRAMADVRRDLFDDESEVEDEEDAVDGEGDSQGPRSTHEKQRARIADEIRRLEAANVAKKEWMLAGEARAVERPVNSLIEEDLDFERVGKPVPVVTNETTEDIEELVKRRILANEFDEVIRRRPGAADSKAPRSSRFELEDTKPQQSLAELYEVDHLRATDPNYVDSKDRKLMREHAEVTNLWKEISSQLDTLSNWHYKPKAPQANINVVTDAPTIMMEEARPTAGSAADGPSALAPQEIYAPGDDGRIAGEVVLKTGASVAKDEMSREEKARARRQKKSSQRKTGSEATQQSKQASNKQQLMSDLKKGGVKVVNKQGQVTDLNGDKVAAGGKSTADALKL
ncbi:hypothetical protein N7492_002860 [Penicillium capsulatum]|uniref:U3 small nucleolar ribonucleoprotein protein MPP10 n=1 Tax=Penicillium capsulatum TaxID=69766 RepID=A0A9W9LW32_9EURO|nr:hypothetical protein N7492_002860 [Penicillium capsulatum]KAJ6122543.1 hypothetical protein N7512_005008 [Penicillium capsulatum]